MDPTHAHDPGTRDSGYRESGDPESGHDEAHALVPYKTYVAVWMGLIVLTFVTIGAGVADLKHMGILVAMLIATVKVTLVILYFMHIRFEKRVFAWFLVAGFGSYAVFVILTFADYYYR